ncbi:uncharacterized protein MKZ38_001385 [Zalerion maritima]|uniref:F-box domain-containing protein n=1 Tax=Zalerion maritima TaxID=339359 RepID=A0AAD5WT43_9PEZI|nr:uncharacterized protein MKZ38_001385 [Zalerion maritima]
MVCPLSPIRVPEEISELPTRVQTSSRLLGLPTELIAHVFSFLLDPVDRACLAVTSKLFLQVAGSSHQAVPYPAAHRGKAWCLPSRREHVGKWFLRYKNPNADLYSLMEETVYPEDDDEKVDKKKMAGALVNVVRTMAEISQLSTLSTFSARLGVDTRSFVARHGGRVNRRPRRRRRVIPLAAQAPPHPPHMMQGNGGGNPFTQTTLETFGYESGAHGGLRDPRGFEVAWDFQRDDVVFWVDECTCGTMVELVNRVGITRPLVEDEFRDGARRFIPGRRIWTACGKCKRFRPTRMDYWIQRGNTVTTERHVQRFEKGLTAALAAASSFGTDEADGISGPSLPQSDGDASDNTSEPGRAQGDRTPAFMFEMLENLTYTAHALNVPIMEFAGLVDIWDFDRGSQDAERIQGLKNDIMRKRVDAEMSEWRIAAVNWAQGWVNECPECCVESDRGRDQDPRASEILESMSRRG